MQRDLLRAVYGDTKNTEAMVYGTFLDRLEQTFFMVAEPVRNIDTRISCGHIIDVSSCRIQVSCVFFFDTNEKVFVPKAMIWQEAKDKYAKQCCIVC